jgi:NAD(P)-dependent dehydrogenase (short-subunit alcohol dehydrogenase family)
MMFEDRVVVITGGSKGFGKALAAKCLKEKSKVIITSNNESELKAAAEELGCDYFMADAGSMVDCTSVVDYVLQKYARINVWINNAGVQIAPSNLEDVDINKLHKLFEINYFGYFYGCKAVLPVMKRENDGIIININSTAGLNGKPGLSAYVSSKFAVKGMTESLREELKGTNIKVYQIFPGGMKTDIYREMVPKDFEAYMDVNHAVVEALDNLKADEPELDMIIRRPVKK